MVSSYLIVRNILEVNFKSGKTNIKLNETKIDSSFEINSDCSDNDSNDFNKYKSIEIYSNENGWKNAQIKNKYEYVLEYNDIDLSVVMSVVKRQTRFLC